MEKWEHRIMLVMFSQTLDTRLEARTDTKLDTKH